MSEPRRNINTQTFDDFSQRGLEGFLPVLVDIRHPGITWNDSVQQNGHLRLVNDTKGMMYKGNDTEPKYYAPCNFQFKLPKEDGKTKSKASITISALDSRIIEVIRSIEEDLTCRIVGMYSKITSADGKVKYVFSKMYSRKFEMSNVSWNGVTAEWELEPDSIADINAPKDKGSLFRFPSLMEK